MANQIWVVPHNGTWGVRLDSGPILSIHDTQLQAMASARARAMREGLELIVLGEDGKIREKNSYGKDPYPPKG